MIKISFVHTYAFFNLFQTPYFNHWLWTYLLLDTMKTNLIWVVHVYSCNEIAMTQIQISCQNWNIFFLKYQSSDDEIGMKFTITDCSDFDKRCSGAHFVSFLFYYYCTKSHNTYAIQIVNAPSENLMFQMTCLFSEDIYDFFYKFMR